MLRDYPWGIGVGETAFKQIYPRYAVSGIESVMHAHQMLLQIMAELGIGGLILFLCFFILLLFYAAYALRTRGGRSRSESVAAISALLGAAVMGAFDILWYQHGICLLFFAVGAILTAPLCDAEREPWQNEYTISKEGLYEKT